MHLTKHSQVLVIIETNKVQHDYINIIVLNWLNYVNHWILYSKHGSLSKHQTTIMYQNMFTTVSWVIAIMIFVYAFNIKFTWRRDIPLYQQFIIKFKKDAVWSKFYFKEIKIEKIVTPVNETLLDLKKLNIRTGVFRIIIQI